MTVPVLRYTFFKYPYQNSSKNSCEEEKRKFVQVGIAPILTFAATVSSVSKLIRTKGNYAHTNQPKPLQV